MHNWESEAAIQLKIWKFLKEGVVSSHTKFQNIQSARSISMIFSKNAKIQKLWLRCALWLQMHNSDIEADINLNIWAFIKETFVPVHTKFRNIQRVQFV